MKILLYIVAAVTFVAPIAIWAYFVGLASAYNTSSPNRGVSLQDYWDMEFLIIAAVPWLISVFSLFFAIRIQ
ncbi:MAG: hypothetical protein ABJY83_20300 [Roseibium sp.]